MDQRRATTADADPIGDVITRVFAADPLWGPALARPDGRTHHLRAYWDLFVAGALRFDCTGIAGEVDAVTVWIPPGEDELSPDQFEAVLALLRAELPGSVDDLVELFDRFETVHPHDEPHYYLSLFATKPESRGRGIGMDLLRTDVAAFDAEGVPTYLESSNPGNDARYAAVGYRPVGRFEHPSTGAVVTTMWRPVGG
ncbi:GNAT family N-acetyltransferase [Longivirga aurantiaca]|uniref:GNAT family N-acetyltransferase n=1 Tax=Longivirga aurantiaca TaxID=1837743 RepID=A0ABW1T4B9_9ACTN